jgi:hypothetical protein
MMLAPTTRPKYCATATLPRAISFSSLILGVIRSINRGRTRDANMASTTTMIPPSVEKTTAQPIFCATSLMIIPFRLRFGEVQIANDSTRFEDYPAN